MCNVFMLIVTYNMMR